MNSKSFYSDRSNYNLAGFVIDKSQEDQIRGFAEKIGHKMGLVASDLIIGIIYLILAKKIPHSAQSDSSTFSTSLGENRLLSAIEVANILNISKVKAYQLMQRGELPSVRMGRTSRVRKQDLDMFVSKHTFHSSP
jgi:excisionase family DNA binding protein